MLDHPCYLRRGVRRSLSQTPVIKTEGAERRQAHLVSARNVRGARFAKRARLSALHLRRFLSFGRVARSWCRALNHIRSLPGACVRNTRAGATPDPTFMTPHDSVLGRSGDGNIVNKTEFVNRSCTESLGIDFLKPVFWQYSQNLARTDATFSAAT